MSVLHDFDQGPGRLEILVVAGVAFKSALFHRSAFFLRIWRNRLIADSVAVPLVASFFLDFELVLPLRVPSCLGAFATRTATFS